MHEQHQAPQSNQLKQDFRLIFLLFISFRLLSLYQLKPGGFVRDFSHYDFYPGIAALSDYGLYPFLDFWLEWPPIVPWLMVGAYKLALFFPVWENSYFFFVMFLGSVFVLFEAGNFYLIYRLACQLWSEPRQVMRVLWFYAGLFSPLFAMLGYFDGMTLFFILLGLHLLLNQRFKSVALTAGLGFVVKLLPILLLAPLLRAVWDKYQRENQSPSLWQPAVLQSLFKAALLYGLIFSLTILVLMAPFLIIAPQWLYTFLRALGDRATWETLWAVLEGYYGYGAVAGDRLNAQENQFAIHQGGWLPWNWINLGFGLFYAFILTRMANYRQPQVITAFLGLKHHAFSALFKRL